MRRSRSIRLVLLGATAVTLGACGDEDLSQGEYFTDEAQCARTVDVGSCRIAHADAERSHQLTAPQFASLQECEQLYGNGDCEVGPPPPRGFVFPRVDPATGQVTYPPPPPPYTYYRPVMHGFWYDRYGSSGSMGAPIYRDRDGYAYSRGTRVGQFSSGGQFSGMSSRRGGFGGFFRSSGG